MHIANSVLILLIFLRFYINVYYLFISVAKKRKTMVIIYTEIFCETTGCYNRSVGAIKKVTVRPPLAVVPNLATMAWQD